MRTKKSDLVIPLLGILAGVFVAMVAAVAMGNIYRGYSHRCCPPYKNSCIANLKQVDGATATWALENKKTDTEIPSATDLYGAKAYIREELMCSQGGKYTLGSVQQRPRCSIPGHTL